MPSTLHTGCEGIFDCWRLQGGNEDVTVAPLRGYEVASGFCVTDTLPTPTYTLTSPRVKTGPWRSDSVR